MTDNFRCGDLVKVSGIFENENLSGVIIDGPYPAVFTISEDGIRFSEETMAVDLMCQGKIYKKIKCNFLKKINDEHQGVTD